MIAEKKNKLESKREKKVYFRLSPFSYFTVWIIVLYFGYSLVNKFQLLNRKFENLDSLYDTFFFGLFNIKYNIGRKGNRTY